MKEIVKLIRPHQWIKNFFLFAPLFFTFNFQSESFLHVTLGFIVFSLAASSIYILNDYKDIIEDQVHPTKKHRPLASGAEKVNRIKEKYTLDEYEYIYAYGDSRGDKEMLTIAHEQHYKPFR